mgnify:CR=1 FL=1
MSIKTEILKLKEELPSNVKLVAVSKFHPLDAIKEAYEAGQRVYGESRPQELYSKVTELQSSPDYSKGTYADIEWHFIGHLQTNKLKFVLPYVSMVESVDSLRLLEAIDSWSAAAGKVTDVLLEYHIAEEDTKQGFDAGQIKEILVSGRYYQNVRIRGLMGMATFTDDEDIIRADFSRLVNLKAELDKYKTSIPAQANLTLDFDTLSFGMTHDYKIAVEMGADIVRIGTMIFGERDYSR